MSDLAQGLRTEAKQFRDRRVLPSEPMWDGLHLALVAIAARYDEAADALEALTAEDRNYDAMRAGLDAERQGFQQRIEELEAERDRILENAVEATISDEGTRLDAALARIKELEAEVAETDRDFDEHMNDDHAMSEAIRAGSTAMLREALGPETFNHFWGPELERLGHYMDTLNARLAAVELGVFLGHKEKKRGSESDR